MSTSPNESTNEQSYRPPGGKALLRQLQLLESAGYIESGATNLESLSVADSQAIAQRYAEAAEMLSEPDKNLPQWKSIGPSKIINGQISGYDEGSASINQRIDVSGRIAAVLVDPQNSNHLLVGSANGGIWESLDRGGSWEARSDYAPTLSIGALAFDPKDSKIVYAGTGEGNAGYSYLGQGILSSIDGGNTWNPLCTNPFQGLGFFDLVVDSNNSQRLFAAVTNGLYISNDSGISWKRAANIPDEACWSIAISSDGKEILAACQSGLWQLTNHGTTFLKIISLPDFIPIFPNWKEPQFTRLAIAIAPSNQSIAYLWGAYEYTDASTNGVTKKSFLRQRIGDQWHDVNFSPKDNAQKQCSYNWCLAVDPDKHDQIYCGAVALYQVNINSSIPPSADWINISAKQKLPGQELQGNSIHADQHAIAFDPKKPDTIYVGNDGGLFRSDDRGINWESLNNGLIISEFEYLAQDDRDPNWIMGGTQDNGTLIWTSNTDYIYTLVGDGDGGDCGVNGSDARIAFRTYTYLHLYRSLDKGNWNSWEDITPNKKDQSSLFYPPFEVSATGGSTIAIGGVVLYVSRDNGTNWVALEQPSDPTLPQKYFLSAMYIPKDNTVYVGTTAGQVFKTVWDGKQWSDLIPLKLENLQERYKYRGHISDIFVSGSTIWITHRHVVFNKGALDKANHGRCVYRSDDYGTTCQEFSNGLPPVPVNAIAVDPKNPNRIWVGTDVGVYQSLDNGGNWHSFSNPKNLPNVYVGDLVFHAEARLLRAGTRNRGIWEIAVDG